MAGALLAQAGLLLYRDSEKVEITEDYLIAGVLRARVAGLELETLQHSVQVLQVMNILIGYVMVVSVYQDSLWKRYLSHCPWLATARQTFFNDLVISKRSSRHNVQAGRAGIQIIIGFSIGVCVELWV